MFKLNFNIFLLLTMLLTGCATSTATTGDVAHANPEKKAQPSHHIEMLGPDNWPTTVAATAKDIIKSLSDKDKAVIQHTNKDDLIMFHHGWGTGIRNYYGLWRGNKKLLENACGKGCHPDDASMVIIEKVWKLLQEQ